MWAFGAWAQENVFRLILDYLLGFFYNADIAAEPRVMLIDAALALYFSAFVCGTIARPRILGRFVLFFALTGTIAAGFASAPAAADAFAPRITLAFAAVIGALYARAAFLIAR